MSNSIDCVLKIALKLSNLTEKCAESVSVSVASVRLVKSGKYAARSEFYRKAGWLPSVAVSTTAAVSIVLFKRSTVDISEKYGTVAICVFSVRSSQSQ